MVRQVKFLLASKAFFKQEPKTFSEIYYKSRKPSWPDEDTENDKKTQEGSTPVKEKIRRWEGRTKELQKIGKQGRKGTPTKRGGQPKLRPNYGALKPRPRYGNT